MQEIARLNKPYTEDERANFIIQNNHRHGYLIQETPEAIIALWYTPEELAQQREEQFNREFFRTSLGYVRRQVHMNTGEIKDFLSDLLPVIALGVNMGQQVTILTYDAPEFTEETFNVEELQHQVIVTPQFIQECFLQLSNDFIPTVPVEEGDEEPVEEEQEPSEPEEPSEQDKEVTEPIDEQEEITEEQGE